MPELPEVETVRRSLEPRLYDGSVDDVQTSALALRQRTLSASELQPLVGARFVGARRHGKYLMLDTSSGHTLLVHLGMTGQLLLSPRSDTLRPHTHVRLSLSSGLELRYVDARRFGSVRVYPTASVADTDELSALGPDPIAGSFPREAFVTSLRATTRDLKSALLDQKLVAGLGNIYVSEALFEARLSPRRKAHRLKLGEAAALHTAIVSVLARGVANRGTTFSDYVDSNGERGSNQHTLHVYGRDGEPCRVCAKPIVRIVQGQRSTFFCSSCQGGKRP
ncbi:MAG: bifunctional DNA-formamidopyrimidine glycosylase/DNA-(apurinic or apyrimidinic site) lyase [Polyangia bacterium]